MLIGIDLVSIARVGRADAASARFQTLVFSDDELAAAGALGAPARRRFLAGRFAIKEAVLKALGCGIDDGIDLRDISTVRSQSGAPVLTLSGSALGRAREHGAGNVSVSLTHEGDMACAAVVIF